MSRGFGRIEREILYTLHDGRAWSAAQLLGSNPSTADKVATRRALRSLAAKGLITRVEIPGPVKYFAMADAEKARQAKKAAKARREAKAHEKLEREAREREARFQAAREANGNRPKLTGDKAARAKLAKTLGMLGSSFDHEILAAAKLAEKARRQLNVSWEKLLNAETEDRWSL